jgi:hypothetical protein
MYIQSYITGDYYTINFLNSCKKPENAKSAFMKT